MKKLAISCLALLLGVSLTSFAGDQYKEHHKEHYMSKWDQINRVRITFNNEEAVVVLLDTPVTRDFISLLPMTVTFTDYVRTEKITYLPRKLTTRGGLSGSEVEGDFAYYAPWGNLAVFYSGFGKGEGLYILGRIESGKDKLGGMSEDFSARIDIVE